MLRPGKGHSSDEWDAHLLEEWVAIDTSYREKRRFLETHLVLLDLRTLDFLARAIDTYAANAEMCAMLDQHKRVLGDAMRRDALAQAGDRLAAVREAYVNWFDGFVLDIPGWLAEVEAIFAASPTAPDKVEGGSQADVLRSAIARCQTEGPQAVPPEVVAELRLKLWDVLTDSTDIDEDDRYEECIAALRSALTVYTLRRYPIRYVATLISLASAYVNRIAASPDENVEHGIALYEQARAIAEREAIPPQLARACHGLANAYLKRSRGSTDQNVEQGIIYCQQAIAIWSKEAASESWALAMNTLGSLYQQRTTGGLRENYERAIDCYRNALEIFTLEASPARYAMVQNNLGTALRHRVAGDPIANAEFAMAAHFEALKVYTKEQYPLDYAMTLCHLASTSLSRPAVTTSQNLESAIRGYREALETFTFERYPERYAMVQNNLGIAYSERPGSRAEDIEMSIRAYVEALRVYQKDQYPGDYARTMGNLGTAFSKRRAGEPSGNLARAISCYQESLSIYTADAFPVEHRLRQLSLAVAAAELEQWEEVHVAYQAAEAIEDRLLCIEATEEARAAFLREGRDTAQRDGFALIRLGRVAEAIVAVERGRARGLAEVFALESADSSKINDHQLRARFEEARAQLLDARAHLYEPVRPPLDQEAFLREWERRAENPAIRQEETQLTERYQTARAQYDAIVRELRATSDGVDLLQSDLTAMDILRIAQALGPCHTIVYLFATPWGGAAVGAFSNGEGSMRQIASLDLPEMTFERIAEMAQSRLSDESLHIIGGFNHAQRGNGLSALLLPIWPGATFRARAMAVYGACIAAGKPSTISAAAQQALRIPALKGLIDRPLADLSVEEHQLLEGTVNHLFLQNEVNTCLGKMGTLIMRPLAAWLRTRGAKSVTLIPCGFLETFPLAAVQLGDGHTFADTYSASTAPSARTLRGTAAVDHERRGIYALGDPRPTHQALPWGEAEALTIAKLARMHGRQGEVRVQERASRDWLIHALGCAQAVFASCHGMFNALDFLRSPLLLARGQSLTIADTLSRQVTMSGMRLVVLSACQTAVPDVRSQTDEVRSLAAGMIQAGARAVLGTLWPVDDEAAYLLIVRFAQEWLPVMDHEPPAHALARAQRWLRTVSNRRLRAWRIAMLPTLQAQDLTDTGTPATWHVPVTTDASARMMTLVVRGRGTRYTVSEAERELRGKASTAPPDARPFADPVYWAGFQVIGW